MGGVRLPAGALVTSIQLEACDTDASNSVTLALFRKASPSGTTTTVSSVTTGVGATPGCAFFSSAVGLPITIDNVNNSYFVDVLSGPNVTTRFHAIRVFYTLQVSPAPAVATFADVPADHPFFQFVEALVASGITVGCGGGLYCVDNPITRGEMAVFLGKALGLHFAP